MTTQDFTIVPIDDVDTREVVGALSEVFGPRTDEWYRWKHLDNPAGRSLGWVAIDDQGVVGVRLFQQWDLTSGSRSLKALRPVDTMTLPRARRRGIFKSLLTNAIESIQDTRLHDVIFNTPNQNSRDGYAKNGWTLLPQIVHARALTSPGRSTGSATTVGRLPHPPPAEDDRLTTDKTSRYIAWRYDRRSGHDYQFAIDESEHDASIVYRIATLHRIRTLVLLETFGRVENVRRLVNGTARRERAAVTIFVSGPGTDDSVRPLVRRGGSVLAVRPLKLVQPEPLDIRSWRLTLGDLEDVL